MMAFLQRALNGDGRIIREMASASGCLNLCLVHENRKYPIELKIRNGKQYLEEGIEQTARYMDIHDCKEGWLAVFDRRVTVKWEEKNYMKKKTVDGKTVTIVGL
jgi:hypothetical protein